MHAEQSNRTVVFMEPQLQCGKGSQLHLFLCAVSIVVTYMYFGVLQEQIFQGDYPDGDRFTFTFSILFIGAGVSTIFATLMLFVTGVGFQEKAPKRLFLPLAFTHLLSLCTTVSSLQTVSYPVMVVVKSVKPIFVMLCATVIGRVRYSTFKYVVVCVAVLGVMLFMYNAPLRVERRDERCIVMLADARSMTSDALGSQTNASSKRMVSDSVEAKADVIVNCSINRKRGTAHETSASQSDWSGDLLLYTSLVFDGLTAGQQERLKAEYATGGYSMMFFMDALMSLYLLVPLIATSEFTAFLNFCDLHPTIVHSVALMIALNVFGQSMAFCVVESFGTLPCSLITTARKFLTVLFSIIFFAHAVQWHQYLGAILVFGALIVGELHILVERKLTTCRIRANSCVACIKV